MVLMCALKWLNNLLVKIIGGKTLADGVSPAKSANVFTTKVLCYTVNPMAIGSYFNIHSIAIYIAYI